MTAQNIGFFAPIENSTSTIKVSLDIDKLKTSRILIGIFSAPDLSADGYILLTAPDQIEPQTFSLRPSNPFSQATTSYPDVPGAKGNYEIEISLTPGEFSIRLQKIYHLVDDISLAFPKRYLYIGIRPERGSPDIDVNIGVVVKP